MQSDYGGRSFHHRRYAERETVLLMLGAQRNGGKRRIMLGADNAYDSRGFVGAARKLHPTLSVTQNDQSLRSNLDRRTTCHAGYAISLNRRWLAEKRQ